MAIPLDSFTPLLQAFLSGDAAVRAPAEDAIRELKKTPDQLVLSLLQSMLLSPEASLRDLSAVLLRKLLSDEQDVWPGMSHDAQEAVKRSLLDAVGRDAIGTWLGGAKWDAAFAALYAWIQSTDNNYAVREAGLYAVELLGMFFAVHAHDQLPALGRLLPAAIADAGSPLKVRAAGARGAVGIIRSCETRDPKLDALVGILGPMLELIKAAAVGGDADVLRTSMSALVDLAEFHALFMKPVFPQVVDVAVSIAREPSVPNGLRQVALEIVVSMAEGAPALARKMGKAEGKPGMFLGLVLPVVSAMMVEHRPDKDWETRVVRLQSDDVDDTNRGMGEEAVQRLADAIRPTAFLGALQPIIAAFLASPEWPRRYAGLRCLFHISESFHEDEASLRALASQLAAFERDPEPKVRWALASVFGAYAFFKGGLWQPAAHGVVVPILLNFITGDSSMRVRANAADALTNFCDMVDPDVIAPYGEAAVTALTGVLATDKPNITCYENALSALSSLADAASEAFASQYDRLMPLLLGIIQTNTHPDWRVARGTAMECLCILGACVPPEKFYPDARKVMEVTVGLARGSPLATDDPLKVYMWQAWARTAKALKGAFAEFLPAVMPSLLEAASGKLDLTGAAQPESDETDVEEVSDDEGNTVRVSTSVLMEKQFAVTMLADVARYVGPAFTPWVERSVAVLLPLVGTAAAAMADIRGRAIGALPRMVSCVAKAVPVGDPSRGNVRVLLDAVLKAYMDALQTENHGDLVLALVANIGACVEHATEVPPGAPPAPGVVLLGGVQRAPILNADVMRGVTAALLTVRQDSTQRRAVRAAERTVYEDEFDEELLELEGEKDEKEDQLVFSVFTSVGALVKSHGGAYLGVFDELVRPVVESTANPACTVSDRKMAVFTMDDVMEFCGADAAKYAPHFIKCLVGFCRDPSPEVRQAAAYGIGAAAKSQGGAFVPHIGEAVAALVFLIDHPEAKAGSLNHSVTDNAVCALGKIVHCQGAAVPNVATLIPYWMSHQPLVCDRDESVVTTQILCARLEGGCPHVRANLGKVVEIFEGVATGKKLCPESLAQRLADCLRAMAPALGGVGVPASLQTLVADHPPTA